MQPRQTSSYLNGSVRRVMITAIALTLAFAASAIQPAQPAWADREDERGEFKPECLVYDLGRLLSFDVRTLRRIFHKAIDPRNSFSIKGYSARASDSLLRLLITDYGDARDLINRFRFAKIKERRDAVLDAEIRRKQPEFDKFHKAYRALVNKLYKHKDYAKFRRLMNMIELGDTARGGRLRELFYKDLEALHLDRATRTRIEEASGLKAASYRAREYIQQLRFLKYADLVTPNRTCN